MIHREQRVFWWETNSPNDPAIPLPIREAVVQDILLYGVGAWAFDGTYPVHVLVEFLPEGGKEFLPKGLH